MVEQNAPWYNFLKARKKSDKLLQRKNSSGQGLREKITGYPRNSDLSSR